MAIKRFIKIGFLNMKKYVVCGFAALLSACSANTLFPQTEQIVTVPSAEKVVLSAKTGTLVGQKVISYKDDLNKIRAALASHAEEFIKIGQNVESNTAKYNDILASLQTKLSLGTTPSNPEAVALYNNAQNTLTDADVYMQSLNQMQADLSALGTQTVSLDSNIKASYALPGALDQDHTNLRTLENGTEQTAIAVKNLLDKVSADASSYKHSIEASRQQLYFINNAVVRGSFGVKNAPLNNVAAPVKPVTSASLQAANPAKSALFTVDFTSEDVAYKKGLEKAVSNALQYNPNTHFDIVAKNPLTTSAVSVAQAKKYAAQVFADVISMGVVPENISLIAKTEESVKTPQVLVFAH